MKFMQHVRRQSLAAVLTNHSRSQSYLQWQSSVQGNSDRLHLQHLLQHFSGLHEHFVKSWIPIVDSNRLIQSEKSLPFTSFHPQASWTMACSQTWPAVKGELKICFINAALVVGMLSVDLPWQRKSFLHSLVDSMLDLWWYNITVKCSNTGFASSISAKVGWWLQLQK